MKHNVIQWTPTRDEADNFDMDEYEERGVLPIYDIRRCAAYTYFISYHSEHGIIHSIIDFYANDGQYTK